MQNKSYNTAIEILESFEKTLKDSREKLKRYERSEVYLLYARIYEAMGENTKAISFLEKNKKDIVDQITYYEQMSRLYMKE